MRYSYKILDGNLDKDGVNKFLIDEYEYDLFDFAHSLAIVLSKKPPPSTTLWEIWKFGKRKDTDYEREYKREYELVADEIRRLERIIKSTTRGLKNHMLAMEKVKNPLLPKDILPGYEIWKNGHKNWEKDEDDKPMEFWIKNNYKFDGVISSEINILKKCLNDLKKEKGAPTKSKNTIAALWSLVMKDDATPHLKNIETLLDWFWETLEGVPYHREIESSSSENSSGDKTSRFVKRNRSLLEKARKEIFFHNYKEFPDKKKTYPYQIRFEADSPKFYPRSSPYDETARFIFFPDGSTFP